MRWFSAEAAFSPRYAQWRVLSYLNGVRTRRFTSSRRGHRLSASEFANATCSGSQYNNPSFVVHNVIG